MMNHVGTFRDFFIAFDYTNERDEMTWYGRFAELPSMKRLTNTAVRIDCVFNEAR